jgi:glycosyltransferase involved in cell wall biosynthesis
MGVPRKLRILFVASTYPPHTGGAERYAELIAEGTASAGHEVTVVTDGLRADGAPLKEHSPGRPQVWRLRAYDERLHRRDKVHWEEMHFSVLYELHGCELAAPDVVHSNSLDAAFLGAILAEHYGVPHVATFHEQAPDRDPFGAGKCKLVYGKLPLDAIIAGSRFYERRALRFATDTAKVRLIYHGIDTDVFSPSVPPVALEGLGVQRGDVVVLASGRLTPRKGFLELVEAMAFVREQLPQVKVLIVGGLTSASEQYAAQVRAKIQALGLQDTVLMVGERGSGEMPGFVAAADIVVQPSHEEGLGLAAIEGMSCARPVVATRVTGLEEIIEPGHNGILCTLGDRRELADALLSLARDAELRQRLGQAGRALAVERYNIRRMIRDTVQLYEQLSIARTGDGGSRGGPRGEI